MGLLPYLLLRLLLQKSFLYNYPDFIFYCFNILKYLIIPKPENLKTGCLQFTCTESIIFSLFFILATVNFDDQLYSQTDKIKYVITEWMLTAKLDTQHLTTP